MASIIASQLGIAAAYVIFILSNLAALGVPAEVAVPLLGVVLCALGCLRDVSALEYPARLALVVVALACALVVWDGAEHGEAAAPAAWDWSGVALAVGIAAFSYGAGIANSLSVARAMRRPAAYAETVGVAAVGVTVLNLAFGVAVAALYGGRTRSIIIEAMNPDAKVTLVIELCLTVQLTLSHPIQLWPVHLLLQKGMHRRDRPLYPLRIAGVLFTMLVAYALRDVFGLFSALVGNVANVSMIFVLPPLISLRLQRESMGWVVDKL